MDLSRKPHCPVDILGKQRSTQTVIRIIRHRNSRVNIVKPRNTHRRPKQLIARNFHTRIHIGENRRLINRTIALAARHQTRASTHRILNPRLHALGIALPHHRPHRHAIGNGIARRQRLDLWRQRIDKIAIDRIIDNHPLR